MPNAFVGRSRALSQAGLLTSAQAAGAAVADLWAVVTVETSGCGFLVDRRPQILFERHLFHALTHGQFDDGDISDQKPGGYGSSGAHQYDRLARAIQCDRLAALKSTSWGLGQILGNNYAMTGFGDVETFVTAMSDSEDAHVAALSAFVRSAGLEAALQRHDWAAFARGYNGPSYAKNRYDIRLRNAYTAASAGGLPDLATRTAQLYLRYLGFSVGPIDGVLGPQTKSAIVSFQTKAGVPPTGVVDDELLAQLAPK
jgi:hypothetical protein